MSDENPFPRTRRRVRKPTCHKKFLNKEKVQKGLEHFSQSGNLIPAKTFKEQVDCKCAKECAKRIDVQRQYEIFKTFYEISSWSSKTIFLRGCITRCEVENRLSDQNPILPLQTVSYNYTYKLLDRNGIAHQVCKEFFCTCLQITCNRANRAFNSVHKNPSAIERRGQAPSVNKVPDNDKLFVKQFIDRFPRYRSHYNRSMSDRYYLKPGLNIKKIYREYDKVCVEDNRAVVTEHMFRDIFNTQFNIHFKRPKTDTCKICDDLKARLKNEKLSNEERRNFEETLKLHHVSVEEKKLKFQTDLAEAKDSHGEVEFFTFDLQKTLETPSLSTSVAYYSRQLWTYNLCIYNEVTNRAYMYMWYENVASRGADAIGSCIIKHLQAHIGADAKKVYLYSDSCGGQNRNIKMTLLLKKVLCLLDNVDEITQKFFIPGHSYNSCDRCFALIEKEKKVTSEVYVPEHWMNIVRHAKKKEPKFDVIQMCANDFFSSDCLLNLIVNRKVNSDNIKINWFDFDEIKNIKDKPFILFIKERKNLNRFVEVHIYKKNILEGMFIDATLNQAKETTISKKKKEDLIGLLRYVPAEYHDFYKQLTCEDQETDNDFGLASDFEEE